MNFNSAMEKALAQARAMQKQVLDATTAAAEQVKPQLQKSLDDAHALQETLTKHAAASSEIAAKQTQVTLGHLGEVIKMGSEAMRESAEQTRAAALKMVEQSKKVVDSATEAMSKTRE